MAANTVFGILGGDRRQLYTARSIAADGYPVYISGFEKCEDAKGIESVSVEELAALCTVIILPLPVSRDGHRLNAPFSRDEIILNDDLAAALSGKTVYGGMMEKLYDSSELWGSIAAYDYYAREELVTGNAFLTAEGAIGVAITEHDGAINGARCLVTGFGRIGKALCVMLRGMGAEVYCCARKAKDLTAIKGVGCHVMQYRDIDRPFDVIFNTVPARVLSARQLARQSADTLVLELASGEGGVDTEAAERLGIRVLNLPSLPGRMSPKNSGELIKEAVYNMLEEGFTFNGKG